MREQVGWLLVPVSMTLLLLSEIGKSQIWVLAYFGTLIHHIAAMTNCHLFDLPCEIDTGWWIAKLLECDAASIASKSHTS
jgi:hypothetical protein